MNTIIVPVDFSDISKNAAVYAGQMASQIHADIILMHVLPLPLTLMDVPIPYDGYEEAKATAIVALEELQQLLEIQANSKISISFQVTMGHFMDELNNLINKTPPFTVIMGTKGTGAAASFFLGSNTRAASRQLKHPLLLVPPGSPYKEIKTIGLASDMKDVADNTPFPQIRNICDEFNASIDILCVSKADEKLYRDILKESRFMYSNLGKLHPEIKIAIHENVMAGLNEMADRYNIDLVLVLSKTHGFLNSLFHKSTIGGMIAEPVSPFMILHAQPR